MARTKEGYFNGNHYAALIAGIFQNALNKVGNAGQVAILEELLEKSYVPLQKIANIRKRPSPSINKSVMALSISQDKYDAVDEIIAEMADQISQAWDDAYAGDNIGDKLFMKLSPADFIVDTPSIAASTYGYRARMINGLL
jgi:hypothetical protein